MKIKPLATLPRVSKLSKKSIPAETALTTQPVPDEASITLRPALRKRGAGNLVKI
jgi:hypothetical protein